MQEDRPRVRGVLKWKGKTRRRERPDGVHWDEQGIAEHDKTRGTRMPIDEPDTPFARSPLDSSSDEESRARGRGLSLEGEVCQRLFGLADADEVSDGYAGSLSEAGDSPLSRSAGAERSGRQSNLSDASVREAPGNAQDPDDAPQSPLPKVDFAARRAMHYQAMNRRPAVSEDSTEPDDTADERVASQRGAELAPRPILKKSAENSAKKPKKKLGFAVSDEPEEKPKKKLGFAVEDEPEEKPRKQLGFAVAEGGEPSGFRAKASRAMALRPAPTAPDLDGFSPPLRDLPPAIARGAQLLRDAADQKQAIARLGEEKQQLAEQNALLQDRVRELEEALRQAEAEPSPRRVSFSDDEHASSGRFRQQRSAHYDEGRMLLSRHCNFQQGDYEVDVEPGHDSS